VARSTGVVFRRNAPPHIRADRPQRVFYIRAADARPAAVFYILRSAGVVSAVTRRHTPDRTGRSAFFLYPRSGRAACRGFLYSAQRRGGSRRNTP